MLSSVAVASGTTSVDVGSIVAVSDRDSAGSSVSTGEGTGVAVSVAATVGNGVGVAVSIGAKVGSGVKVGVVTEPVWPKGVGVGKGVGVSAKISVGVGKTASSVAVGVNTIVGGAITGQFPVKVIKSYSLRVISLPEVVSSFTNQRISPGPFVN